MSSLSPEQIQIIKATAPVLQERGKEITTLFYKDMLTEIPDLNNGKHMYDTSSFRLPIVRLVQFSIRSTRSMGIKLLHLQAACTPMQHTSTIWES